MQALKFDLVHDNAARSKAVVRADVSIQSGDVILRVPALVTALLPNLKGKRCDSCCRRRDVKACSKCHAVWYCDATCQMHVWKGYHRKVCGYFSKGFHLSTAYLAQDSEQQSNGDLLLNLYGHLASSNLISNLKWERESTHDLALLSENPVACFVDLVSHPSPRPTPVLPSILPQDHQLVLQKAWSRFDCNNFVLHRISSLEPESGSYALGVFPLASRCFNHSCAPNAWCASVLQERQAWLEIRALRPIEAGQEITITYLDPALTFAERQARLRFTYNFTCVCHKCTTERLMQAPSTPPSDTGIIEDSLAALVFTSSTPSSLVVSNKGLSTFGGIPSSLACIRHEDFMKNLSQRFENETHDGPYDAAWRTGRAMLAMCLLQYPKNYPLTAYYALELAKACWNGHVGQAPSPPNVTWLECVISVLEFAEPILRVVGGEEEETSASGLATCETLRKLIRSEPS